jgi:hypothetical protein
MPVCRELVNKSKALQQEILAEGRGRGTEKEFYKKNSRYSLLWRQNNPGLFNGKQLLSLSLLTLKYWTSV